MENIVKSIIDIELRAQGITEQALEKQRGANDFVVKESARLKDAIFKQSQQKLCATRDKYAKEHKLRMDQIEKEHKDYISELNKKFSQNSTRWQAQILDGIIKEGGG